MGAPPQTKLIVIVAFPDLPMLEIAGPADVFFNASKTIKEKTGIENAYEVVVVAADRSDRIVTRSGIAVYSPLKIDDIKTPIDTLLVAGYNFDHELENAGSFYNWLSGIYPQVRRIGSICVGTFALARAGILEHKNATTHWERGPKLSQEFPNIHVDPSRLYIRDGNIYTSGGVSSGTDLALALVEEDYGRDIALTVARKLVLYLKRPGNQSQFSELLPEPELDHGILSKLREWIVTHLDGDLSVEKLAAQSNMSPRNFARTFLKDTGVTPAKFIEKLRVEMARKLLEDSDLNIEQIAEKAGLGNLVSMRRVFIRNLMVTPSDYRRTFKTTINEPEAA